MEPVTADTVSENKINMSDNANLELIDDAEEESDDAILESLATQKKSQVTQFWSFSFYDE